MSELITNRTEGDVQAGAAKGFYNADDLNRVGAAVGPAAALLAQYGYYVRPVVCTDWEVGDLPGESDLEQYLQNVREIAAAFVGDPELPETMAHLTWQGANAIENTIQMTRKQVPEMAAAFRAAGTFCTGE